MNPKLDKNNIKSIVIFVMLLAIYNIVAWVIPFNHDETFIGAYIFGTFAIVSQIGVKLLALSGGKTLKDRIYAYPIVRMGAIYSAIQLVVSLLFAIATTVIDDMPPAIVYAVSAIILAVFVILILRVDTTRDEIVKLEQEEKRTTVQIKTFRVNIDSIVRCVEDKELLSVLNKLSDVAKYSDPVSSPALYQIESYITCKIDELNSAVRQNDVEAAKMIAKQAINLFEDRNQQCKMFKQR